MLYALVIVVLCVSSSVSGHLVKEFPFTIGATALYRPLGRLFLSAQNAGAREYALSTISRTTDDVIPLTPEEVTLNQVREQSNPLFDEAIVHLSLLDRRPVVVPQGLSSTLFLVDDRVNPRVVTQSAPVRNVQGEEAPFLLALTTTASENATSLDAGASLAALVAVPNKAGGFDGSGSGIALAALRQIIPQAGTSGFLVWDIFDALTGMSSFQEGVPLLKAGVKGNFYVDDSDKNMGNKAAPFDKTTPQLCIGADVARLENTVDLHFDRDLGRLYIATDVTAGSGTQAGARAIVVASIAQGKILYHAIAPDSVFNGTNQIIGKRQAASRSVIFKVRTMQTRNHLRYLIVVGGNGADESLKQQVFALPLVDNLSSPFHGALASIHAKPVTLFAAGNLPRFQARVFADPAQTPQDLYTMESPQAQVGGQGRLPGPIVDITVATEAVFVSTGRQASLNTEGVTEGIFYSQPVFDTGGRISKWTDWKRVGNSFTPIKHFTYDLFQGLFWYVPQDPSDLFSTRKVVRTQWTANDEFARFITNQFPQDRGGVLNLLDYGPDTQGFVSQGEQRISVQLFTGVGKVLLVQSGAQQNGLFVPQRLLTDLYTNTDGSMQGFQGGTVLSFSGGALAEIGALRTATLFTSATMGWFVVAGEHGVAILADQQGSGWQIPSGLGNRFNGLRSDFSWQQISSIENVRKIVAQDNHLFVLTDTQFVRFEINPESVLNNSVSSALLYQASDGTTLSDIHVKGPLAVMGTSRGLLRSGNSEDVRVAHAVDWSTVPLGESVGSLEGIAPISRLFPIITNTGDDTLYVLNGVVSLNQAVIYRVALSLTEGKVTETSVQPFDDVLLQGVNTFFTNVGTYRNYVVTDGALINVSRSAQPGSFAVSELLSSTLRSGELAPRFRLPFAPVSSGTVGPLVRSSVTGAWMLVGDFGIKEQL